MVIGHDLNNCWKLRVFWLQKRSCRTGEDSSANGEINRNKLTLKKAYHCTILYRHAKSFYQLVCHREICQNTVAGQNKSSLHTLLLRGTYIIGWMRLHGFGHRAPQGRVHFGTFKRAWQCGVLYSLWENHMLQTKWPWMCAKIDLCSFSGVDLCSKSVKWERTVTFTLRASYNTVG